MSRDPTLSRIELLQGTLDLIRANSRGLLQVETGSLYPALHRLAAKKYVAAEWQTSDNGQRVRVYTLTAAGRKQLNVEVSRWQHLTRAIEGLMQPPTVEGEV